MKSNSLLTTLLIVLLLALIAVAGYKACAIQDKNAEQERFEKEYQQSLKDLGYSSDTSNVSSGSAYVGDNSSNTPTSTNTAPSTPATSTGTTPPPAATPVSPAPEPRSTAPKATAPTPATSTTTSKAPTAPKTVTAPKTAGTGRYLVVAGTFGSWDNARKRLEEVIKMGYTNAEIAKKDNFAIVVVKRTNNLGEATRVMDQLEDKKLDARVVDMQKK